MFLFVFFLSWQPAGFADSDLELLLHNNVNTDSESYVLDSESYGTEV